MRVLVLAAVSFITFRWVLIPIRTEGSSMLPTYAPDKLHFVNRLAYGASGPARGDVVAIQIAGPHVVYIKRVVGLPGERVAIVGRTGADQRHRARRALCPPPASWDFDEVTLGPREYFVIGDNRGTSDYGRATVDKILGKVVF